MSSTTLAAFSLRVSLSEFDVDFHGRDGHHVVAAFGAADQAIADRLYFRDLQQQILRGIG